jgi:hypothetical protein
MQSVMNHARNFNNLLIEVEAYGYTVDETIVSLATTIYTFLEVGDMLNTAITVLWLHSVIPDLRKCHYLSMKRRTKNAQRHRQLSCHGRR